MIGIRQMWRRGQWGKAILSAVGRVCLGLLSPLVFTTFFGPSAILYAVKSIRSDLALLGKDKVGPAVWDLLFTNAAAPGTMDYCIQYFTAILVTAFWAHTWLNTIVLPFERLQAVVHSTALAEKEQRGRLIGFFASGIFMGGWALYHLIFGGAANLSVLQNYLSHTTQWGQGGLPPTESPITWVRFAVFFHGMAMLIWPVTPSEKTTA